jgi:hypothetical protein
MELMWATIPCLMIVAAAFPAVITIATGSAGDSRALFGKWLSAELRARDVRPAPSNVTGVTHWTLAERRGLTRIGLFIPCYIAAFPEVGVATPELLERFDIWSGNADPGRETAI